MVSRRAFLQSSAASLGSLACGASPGRAGDAPGVTETEIKIGQTMPYSGPLVGLWRDRQNGRRLFRDDQ